MEDDAGSVLSTPHECVPTRTLEHIVAFIVPQISEERVENRTPEQIVDFPVLQNMEGYARVVRAPPQKCVQIVLPESVVDVPLPHIKQGAVSTGSVFTVKLRHHRDDHACSDNVGFIKGLDKHNMPRFGDVMVPPPQINKVSWFDRKPQAAANEPLSTSCFMVAYTHSANCALPLRSHRCCSWCLCVVVVQRLVPGRYSADYCEGSAVAVL